MTLADAATRHVVERCPSCGVEHEVRVPACEACDTPLRPWCRVHGRQTGWLDAARCPRCAEEATRPPVPQPAPAPRVTRPAAARPRPRRRVHAGGPVRWGARAPVEAERPPASMMARVSGGFLSALFMWLFGWLAGAVAGAVYAFNNATGIANTAGSWGRVGALVGLFIGVANAVVFIAQSSGPLEK